MAPSKLYDFDLIEADDELETVKTLPTWNKTKLDLTSPLLGIIKTLREPSCGSRKQI